MGSSSRFILPLTTSPFLSLLLHPRPRPFHFRLARLSLATTPHHRLSRPSPFPIKATHHHHHIHTQTNNNNSSSSSTLKEDNFGDSHSSFLSNPPRALHPWPEWSHLLHSLSTSGYFDQNHHRFGDGNTVRDDDDEYVAYETLSEEFVRAASACLAFARNRSDILGSLSRRDIGVIVENGTPFLFKSARDSSRRMRSFLGTGRTNVLESGKAEMVDLMKYLLSYASNPSVSVSSERNNLYHRDNIESSVRNLLSELAEMSSSSRAPLSDHSAPEHYQVSEEQAPRPLVGQQNIEMKRGDWICPKCTFMNFARNNKCLECEEPRPKRQLTGGEWECPQCDFFNYGRNMSCLRCDCERPGEVSFSTVNPRPAYNGDCAAASKANVDSSNQEKAERWFTKVSQQNNVSDLPDEDFPEIMPLRRGENRFVVSTRKTPLERRLEKSQYLHGSSNESVTKGNTDSHQAGREIRTLDSSSINRSLDQILGPTSSKTETRSTTTQFEHPRGNNTKFSPFVPLPADMFAKKPQNPEIGDSEKVVVTQEGSSESVRSKSSDQMGPVSVTNHHESVKSGESIVEDNKDEREARKPDRWFKKVAELHDVPDLARSPMPNEDFPEMMPMRKGENRFVISKKKDRSFTSPTYKRQMAVEQEASNSKFVPFVPFPPDYFAKKDQKQPQQPNVMESTVKNFRVESSSYNTPQNTETQQTRMGGLGEQDNRGNHHPTTQKTSVTSQSGVISNVNSNNSSKDMDLESGNKKDVKSSISGGWSGKSLEGSAVKETDPLDMSEEAKAERWFRRVAQIKDISELSQIPDEDFPSIMPMRKGVNRFVVSKRKTPLERRLTSPQYRRNLPIVERSDPPPNKENNDGN